MNTCTVHDNAQSDQSPKQDVYAPITAKIVAALEDGVREGCNNPRLLPVRDRAKPVGRSPTCFARTGSPSRPTTAGRRSTAGWNSVRCSD